jgi:serine/threonine-protein kinase
VIVDFGQALTKEAKRVTYANITPNVGTPDYMSPEQIEGQRGDQRADIYAVGTMMYELLAGERPFTGDNYQIVMTQHLQGAIPRLDHVKPSVPPQLAAVVARTLQRSPADRYTTMRDLIHDLDHLDQVDMTILETGTGEKTALAFWQTNTFRSLALIGLGIAGVILLFLLIQGLIPR